jgi:hypothetical protein
MTRANTEHPTRHRDAHATHGGEHTDALEHGMPHDRHSLGAGPIDSGVGVKPSSTPNHLERAEYPEPGEETSGGGAHNHRSMPTPSKEGAAGHTGGRGVSNAKGAMGDGRGTSGKYKGTTGSGEVQPKYKGCMGC